MIKTSAKFSTSLGLLITLACAGANVAAAEDGLGAYDWSGVYLGGHMGGVAAELEGQSSGGVVGTVNPTPSGVVGGVLGGYNHQIGRLILGIEADASFALANDLDSGSFALWFEGKYRRAYSVRARLGMAIDRTMLYATAGPTWAETSIDDQATGVLDKKTHFGVQLGAGVEHAFSNNLIFRAEYLFGGYDREQYSITAGGSDTYGLETQVARVAAIWKFGGSNDQDHQSVAGFSSAPNGFSWSGFYLGGHAGMIAGDLKTNTYTGVPNTVNPSPTGFVGGVLGGYNYQVNALVLGLEADASFARATDLDGGSVPGWFEGDLTTKFSVRGRLGYAMGRALFFATGGPAWASAGVDEQSAGVKDKNTHFGFEVGGGIEVALTPNILLRGEYLYGHFGKENYVVVPAAPADSYSLETHTARLAAIWKFGDNGAPEEAVAGFGAGEPRRDWTGLYIGAHAGGLAADLSSDTYTGAPGTVNPKPTGIFGGVLAGYNHQIDRYVLGLEADVSFVRANDMDGTSNGGGLFFEGDLRETYSVRARAGYLVDQTLLFATAGPAIAAAGVDNQVAGIKSSNKHLGVQVGGGLEHALNSNLLLRAEYLYSAFEKESYTVVAGAPSDSYSLDAHSARLALIWNFGAVR